VEPWSSRAPTVIASGSSPGETIVPLNGPELPADVTTVMPACHAVSTAWSRGFRTVDVVGIAPSEMFNTPILYCAWWATTQLMPEMTVARSVMPVAPATLTATSLAPGASPL
jgi:hypothetical protein